MVRQRVDIKQYSYEYTVPCPLVAAEFCILSGMYCRLQIKLYIVYFRHIFTPLEIFSLSHLLVSQPEQSVDNIACSVSVCSNGNRREKAFLESASVIHRVWKYLKHFIHFMLVQKRIFNWVLNVGQGTPADIFIMFSGIKWHFAFLPYDWMHVEWSE